MNALLVMGILGALAALAALAALVIVHVEQKARVRERIKAITEERP